MEFFRIRHDIPFMSHALQFNVVSAIMFLLAVVFLVINGLHFNIEFTGGTVIELKYASAPDIAKTVVGIRRRAAAMIVIARGPRVAPPIAHPRRASRAGVGNWRIPPTVAIARAAVPSRGARAAPAASMTAHTPQAQKKNRDC